MLGHFCLAIKALKAIDTLYRCNIQDQKNSKMSLKIALFS